MTGTCAKLTSLLIGLHCVHAATISVEPLLPQETGRSDFLDHSFTSGLRVMYKSYRYCEHQEDVFGCLKLKVIKFADRALKMKEIPVFDGVSLVKREDEESRRLKKENPLEEVSESNLPVDPVQRQEQLDDLILDRIYRFLSGHTLQLSVPKFFTNLVEDVVNNETVEKGRGKIKKYGGALLLGLLMKGGMMALAYKGIALLAGKALLIAKIALVLSAIIGLKKLVSHGGHEEKVTYEIVKHPHVSHSHSYSSDHYGGGHYDISGGGVDHYHRRSLDNDATELAYRGQKPGSLQRSS